MRPVFRPTRVRQLAAGSAVRPWILLLFLQATALGMDDVQASAAAAGETIEGQPIDAGFVILDGEYLPRPYVVGRRGDDLLVNGRLVAGGWFAEGRPGPGMGRGRGPGMGRGPGGGRGWPPRRTRQPNMLARVERRLTDNDLLIRLEDATVRFIASDEAILVLDALLSDAAREAKVRALMDLEGELISPAEWSGLVESFQPTAELARIVRPLAEPYKRVLEQDRASHERLMSNGVFRSREMKYAVTVAAFVLAVLALGNLMSQRPKIDARWRDVDSTGEGVPAVAKNVLLLVLLGLFDLACTFIAEQAGGFTEMNPLGTHLTGSPVALVSFKTAALVGACGILMALRRYRGAQVASWWLCLVCTVLAFRWLTYNSMFLT